MKTKRVRGAATCIACLCAVFATMAFADAPNSVHGGDQMITLQQSRTLQVALTDAEGLYTGEATVLFSDENGASGKAGRAANGVFRIPEPGSKLTLVVERPGQPDEVVTLIVPAANGSAQLRPAQGGTGVAVGSPSAAAAVGNISRNAVVPNRIHVVGLRAIVQLDREPTSARMLESDEFFPTAPLPQKSDNGLSMEISPVSSLTGASIELRDPRNADTCQNATPIACGDTDVFSSLGTTSDPLTDLTSSCEIAAGGPYTHDASVWYEFTASDPQATISMCGSPLTEDSVMTLFTADSTCGTLTELACDDDTCSAPDFGPPEIFATGLVPGETYLILIDFYQGGHTDGPHTLSITCGAVVPTGACCLTDGTCQEVTESDCVAAGGTYLGNNTSCAGANCNGACCHPDDSCTDGGQDDCTAAGGEFQGLGTECATTSCARPCNLPDTSCQNYILDNASQSNDTAFTSADDFTPESSGVITEVCWWGAYLPAPGPAPDFFYVTYYDDNGGVPGSIIGGPFSQAGGTLNVTGPFDTGDLVANTAPIFEYSATHIPVPVVGGDCYWVEIRNNSDAATNWFWEWSNDGNGRVMVDGDGVNPPDGYTAEDAQTGNDFAFCVNQTLGDANACAPSGACCFSDGTCQEVPEGVCTAGGGAYQGDGTTCATTNCNGACCAPDGSCTDGSFDDCDAGGGVFQGLGTECATTDCPIAGADDCDAAIVIPGLPYSNQASNDDATPDGNEGTCDKFYPTSTGLMQNDIWWVWTADQDCLLSVTATPIDAYDTILVVRDDCVTQTELACADEGDFGVGEAENILIQVTAGTTYYFQVGDTGSFETGGETLFEVECLQIVGGCCLPDQSCVVTTEADCLAQGGDYLGDGTNCAGDAAGNPTTYSSAPNAPIPDSPDPGLTDTITVPDSFAVGDVNVSIQIDHTFLADLEIELTHNGNTVLIMDDTCGGNNNMDLVIDDEAGDVVCAEPTVGSGNPVSLGGDPLAGLDGLDSAGDWTLTVTDDAGADTGTLLSWSLILDGSLDPCAKCEPCPAGTEPLVDGEGDFAGWCIATNSGANVDFAFDAVTDDLAVIEISKDFNYPPGFGDLISPILIEFVQVCPDELTVPMIFIADETITNQTGVEWTDFHWILFDGPESWFDVSASAGFSTAPFADATFSRFIDSPTNNKAKMLDAVNGVVPDGTSFFPGYGAGELKIGIDLSNDDPVSFTLKERPTTAGPASGACCFSDGSCSVLTEAECIDLSGLYQGDDTVCDPNPCPKPTGACCSSAGCTVENADDCTLIGGTYQGDGVSCDTILCNDVCASAAEAFNGQNVGTNGNSVVDDPDPSCSSSGDTDIWWFYTATDTGSLLIETCGTFLGNDDYDTIMAAYDGCGGNELDCDDDCTSGGGDPAAICRDEDQTGFGGTRDSCLCVDVTAGDTVWIQVLGFSGDAGDTVLNITPLGCPPPVGACCFADGSCQDLTEDDCVAAGGVYEGDGTECATTVCATIPDNDDCDTCTDMTSLPFSDSVDTSAATQGPFIGSCNSSSATGTDNDIWYCYTPTVDCTVDFAVDYSPVDGAGYDGLTVIYSGADCATMTELDCLDSGYGSSDDDATSFAATAGTTYWFQIGDWGTTGGGGDTDVSFNCTP